MQLLGGFGDGIFDDGTFRILGGLGAVVIDVDSLIGGRLGPVDRVDAGCCDAAERAVGLAILGDDRKLPQHAYKRCRQRLQSKVRVPQTEI